MNAPTPPDINRKIFIKDFLKIIRKELEKGLPKKANEWDMTIKAYKIFHRGIKHLLKDEKMSYGKNKS